MKKIFWVILFFLSFTSYSQKEAREVTIKLLDSETELPIEEATALILQTNQGLVSNSEGIIKIQITRPLLIEITHSFYKLTSVRSSNLKEDVNVIYMKKNDKMLNEVVLSNSHPQELLKTLIKNSQKKLTIPANLQVYTREFFKKNGLFSYYNDGLLNFQISNKSNKVSADILIEQNRTIGLIDTLDVNILGYDLNNLIENYYRFQYLNEVLDSKSKKMFDFQINENYKNGNLSMMIIKPYILSKGFYFEYSVVFDDKKKLILEITSKLLEERINSEDKTIDINGRKAFKSNFKAIYREDDNDYYLAYSKEEIGIKTVIKKKEVKIEVKNYFNTVKFSKKVFDYKPAEVYVRKSLLFKPNSILTEYWNLESGIALTNEEKDVINKLKN